MSFHVVFFCVKNATHNQMKKAAKIAVMSENSEQSLRGVRMGKFGLLEHAELANQIEGFRIPDRWDASEKNEK